MEVDMNKVLTLKALDALASATSAKIDEIATNTMVVNSGGLSCYLGNNPPENFNGIWFKPI